MEASTKGYDPMHTFYEDQNEFFGNLAVSDPPRAVFEITDYMLKSRIDPPMVFHIELMGILAKTYENSGQLEKAQIALEEVEYLSRDLQVDMDEVGTMQDLDEAEAVKDMGETEVQTAENNSPEVSELQPEDQSPFMNNPIQNAEGFQERFMAEAEQEMKATKEESLHFRYLRNVYLRVDETRAEEYAKWWKVHDPRTYAMYQLADRKNQQYAADSKSLADGEEQQEKTRDQAQPGEADIPGEEEKRLTADQAEGDHHD